MTTNETPRPGTNRRGAQGKTAKPLNNTQATAAGREFVEPTGQMPGQVYYVSLCGDLGQRLEETADRRGLPIETVAAELIEEGLVRDAMTASLVSGGEGR